VNQKCATTFVAESHENSTSIVTLLNNIRYYTCLWSRKCK